MRGPPAGSFDDLIREDLPRDRILVADVDVDFGGLDHVGGDQRALEKAVRIGIEEVLILEGARLTFVAR